MQVKKYTSETLQDALQQVKDDLGAKAIILGTKKVKVGSAFGLFGKEMIEITASDQSLPKEMLEKKKSKETPENPSFVATVHEEVVSEQKSPYNVLNDIQREKLIRPIQKEIHELKSAIADLSTHQNQRVNSVANVKSVQHDLNEMKSILFSFLDQGTDLRLKNVHKNLASLYKQLIANGIEERFAIKIIEESQRKISRKNMENFSYVKLYLARMLMQVIHTIEFTPPQYGQLTIAFIGSTGVGKTTTLAKIASQARMENPKLDIGLITVETYRLGAVEQLKEYARKIKVKFRVAQSSRELNQCLRDFSDMDMVLIDTPGASQRDSVKISELQSMLENKPNLRNCLLLPANLKDKELVEITKRYSSLDIYSVIFTKLDEATTYGNIFNYSIRFKLPLSHLTAGQQVPEDFENATKERLIDLLMNISGDIDDPFSTSDIQQKNTTRYAINP